jgi:ComF family protein
MLPLIKSPTTDLHMRFSKLLLLQRLYQSFLDAIFPRRCLICGAFEDSEHSDGRVGFDALTSITAPCFCGSCRQDLRPIISPFCSKCGRPFVSREGDNHVCGECLVEQRHFRKARSFGVYDGALMEAIHRLKYGKHTSLSQPLSALVRETFFQCWDRTTVDLLVPVPLHVKRLRQRGFNQSHLLIKGWAKREGISFDGLTLWRSRWTEPQTELSRKERKKNIKGAFQIKHPERIKGKKIVLVDDVYTTGSTVNECARVLMKAGAVTVDVLTLARAIWGRGSLQSMPLSNHFSPK